MKFHDPYTGEQLSEEEVLVRAVESAEELQDQAKRAREFAEKIVLGTLEDQDAFLDMSSPMQDGYDRTGPSFLLAEAEEDVEGL